MPTPLAAPGNQLPSATAPIEQIEAAVRQQSEAIKRAYGNILKQLYYLYTRQPEIEAAHLGAFLDGRSKKFSFSAYLTGQFGYSASTASQYHGILRMIEAHQAAPALDDRAEVKVLRQILALPDEGTKTKMLGHLAEITRDNFDEWLAKLSPPNQPPRPHLSGFAHFKGLKKKIDPKKHTLTIKGDLDRLQKLDQLLETISEENLDRLVELAKREG